MTLGEVLKQLRSARKLTLREVEKGTSIANGNISLIEQGRVKSPDPRTLHKLATFYNYPYNDLLELAGHPVASLPFGIATKPISSAVQSEIENLETIQLQRVRYEEIECFAKDLLATCEIKGPPTNSLKILSCLSLHLFPLEYLALYGHKTRQNLQKIRQLKENSVAILDRPDKCIYLDPTLEGSSRTRAIFHEVGHYVIPWHKDLFSFCVQTDLNQEVNDTLEMEANLFANECIFQGEIFAKESVSYDDINIPLIKHLAACYEASLETTAWRFVESHYLPCAMMLSVPVISDKSNERSLEIKYCKTSSKFRWPELITVGRLLSPQNPMVKLFFGETDTQILQQEFKIPIAPKEKARVILRTESVATPQYVLTVMRDRGVEL